MGHLTILVQVFSLILGISSLIYIYQLYIKHKDIFIRWFFFYMLIENIYLISSFIPYYLIVNILTTNKVNTILISYYLIMPIKFTIFSGLLFTYYTMLFPLKGLPINIKTRTYIFGLYLFVLVTYFVGLALAFYQDFIILSEVCRIGLVVFFYLSIIWGTITLLVTQKKQISLYKKRSVIALGLFFLIFHLLNFLSNLFGYLPQLKLLSQIHYLVDVFVINAFPIIWVFFMYRKTLAKTATNTYSQEIIDHVAQNHQFSNREKEIVELILEGLSNKEISERLFISFHTVKNHLYNIYSKLGINSRSQLIHLMIKKD